MGWPRPVRLLRAVAATSHRDEKEKRSMTPQVTKLGSAFLLPCTPLHTVGALSKSGGRVQARGLASVRELVSQCVLDPSGYGEHFALRVW
jgi:hypothetical protein